MKIGKAYVDFDKLYIRSSVGVSKIEPKVFDVLRVLVNRRGQDVTRDELIDEVWGIGFGGDERLSRAISLLRKAFGDKRGSNDYIRTISRKGYSLTAKVVDDYKEDADTDAIKPLEMLEGVLPLKGVEIGRRSAKFFVASLVTFSIFTAFALFMLIRGSTSFDRSLTVESGLENVLNFTRPGAIEEAQTTFSTILADNPNHAAARAGLAFALIREHTYQERDPYLLNRAYSAAEAAYRIDENLALANIAVGWTLEFRGDFETALKYFDRADILDPDNLLAIEGRARTFYKQGDNARARDVVSHGHAIDSNYPHFYTLSGLLYLKENNFSDAESNFRKLIQLSDATNSRAYAQLAHTLHHQGKTEEAIQVLQDGLELNEDARLYNNLGTFLFFQGHYTMAANAFERTLEYAGDTHDYLHWANLADSYRYIPGKMKKANAAYERAIELINEVIDNRPDDLTLRSRAALYHVRSGKLDKALDFIKSSPNYENATAADYFRLCLIYENLSEREHALDSLKMAILLGYTQTEIINEPDLKNLRQDIRFHLLISDTEDTNGQ